MNSDVAIIRPALGTHSPRLGPIAAMVSNQDDLLLLMKQLGLKEPNHRRLYTSNLYFIDNSIPSFSAVGPFIGAAYAVMLLETLIAWGVKKFVFLGWCGAISADVNIGDIIIPTGAIADEGTSKHYRNIGDHPVSPTTQLMEKLKIHLQNSKCIFHEGIIWTTDGIFRETQEKIICLQQKKILAIEMELSAVLSVALFHQVDICAMLVVSDKLSSLTWLPGFTDRRFRDSRKMAGNIAAHLCRKLWEMEITEG